MTGVPAASRETVASLIAHSVVLEEDVLEWIVWKSAIQEQSRLTEIVINISVPQPPVPLQNKEAVLE